MKNVFTLIAVVILTTTSVFAQVSRGGQPINWQQIDINVEPIRLPELDMATIEAEDAERDQYKEFAYRFGIERSTNLNTQNSGLWTVANGRNVWRLAVYAPEAKSLSFLFTEFELPKGARLFIYDKEQTHFIGSFTSENKQANGMLATSLVYGENAVVELVLPKKFTTNQVNLTIGQIVHGYRGFNSHFKLLKEETNRGPFGGSGSCNINVNCPLGDDWQVEKKSVAIITSGGSGVCTGALINNTSNDGYPYFLTANHCLGGVGNWVFYFNHESSTCNGNTGPTNESVSGATVVASNADSDFALLEINNGDPIPANFDIEWAGWDNSDNENAVTECTGIHHPGGDIKKICFDEDGAYHANQGGAAVWYIDEWEEGTTEGGSSGSPLFNQDKRIIGQLYGGAASCQNLSGADWYGRFGVSWDNGNSASSRLHDWLSPGNPNITTLDGYPTGAVVYNLDAASGGIINVPEVICNNQPITPTFVLRNNGTTNLTSADISYSFNGGASQSTTWTGNLAQNQTTNIQLNSFGPQIGSNTISVTISNPNGQTDENGNNNTVTTTIDYTVGEEVLTLEIETDNYGWETYWEVRGPNNQVVASGGNTLVGPNGGGNETAQEGDPGAYSSNSTYNETIELDGDGCYTFLIVDDFADGICCGFFTGSGSYTLRDGNGTVMASGGEFGAEEEAEFGMVAGLSVAEETFGAFNVYPNPTNGTLFIDIEKADQVQAVEVVDVTGRVVASFAGARTNRSSIELKDLKNGIYNVNLISNESVASKRVVLLKD